MQSSVIKFSLRETLSFVVHLPTLVSLYFFYSKFFIFLVSFFRMLAKDELVAILEKCVDVLISSSAKSLRKALEKLERYVQLLKNLEGTEFLLDILIPLLFSAAILTEEM